ncbi:MAG: hypothetical protein ABW196_00880 [Solirubrobacterales bacterium]
MSDLPFIGTSGKPRLVECAVLYFDLLGVSAMAQGDNAQKELEYFNRTIRSAFPYEIGAAAEARENGAYPTTVFSDSIVLAVPILEDLSTSKAVFQVALEVAQLQTELATCDYFARGAITLDKFHSYEGLLFGPALVEAASLERDVAVDPRIVLSPAASAALLQGEAPEGGGRSVYEEAPVLVDEDGVPFVDYLSGAFQADPQLELPDRLSEHRDAVVKQLEQQQTNFGRWSKHRWVAEYHNSTCRTYREPLEAHGGFEAFLIDSIHTRRQFEPLRRLR